MLLVRLDDNTIANAVTDAHFKCQEDTPRHAVSEPRPAANATMPRASSASPGQSRLAGDWRDKAHPVPAPIRTLTVEISVLCVTASQTMAAAVQPLMITRMKA